MPINTDFLDVAKLDTEIGILDTKIANTTSAIVAAQGAQTLKIRQRDKFREQKKRLIDFRKKIQEINN